MVPVRHHQFGGVHEQAVLQVAACERRGQPALIENHADETRPIRSPRKMSMQATRNRLRVQGGVFMGYTLMGFGLERSAGFA